MPALSESWNSRAVLQRGRLERNSIDGMGTVRTNWMRRLLPVVGLAVAMSASGLDLTVDGRSDYRIVVDETAIPAEKTAARELQKYIELLSGVTLPVVGEAQPDGRNILVGRSPEVLRRLEGRPEIAGYLDKDDAVILKTFGDTLVVSGARPRGTLYAVYTLLEDYWGVRWWSPTEELVPERRELAVPDELSFCYAPQFFSREAHYYQVNYHPDFVPFAVKLKSNGHFQEIPEEWGGHVALNPGFVHTILALLPPDRYFEAHPEWYALDEAGKRTAEQPCWSEPAMQQELIRQTRNYLREHPGVKILSISQMDGWVRCRCERCAAVEEETGSPAGPILQAVNAVAAAIESEFPDVVIETLAYVYSQKPPVNADVHRNVLIRLCPYLCDFSRPYASEANAAFRDDLLNWRKLADRLGIWDYNSNFSNYLIPHPNIRTLGANLRLFADNNVEFVFAQGDIGTSNCGEFIQMRAWVVAHLLWNPYLDQRELEKEFLHGYYSPEAGDKLLEVIDLMAAEFERSGKPLGCYRADANDWLSMETLQQALRRFDEAAAALEALPEEQRPVCRERLRRARLPYDIALLYRPESSAWNPALTPEERERLWKLWEEVKATLQRNNVVDFNEITRIAAFYELMPKLLGGPARLKRSGEVPEFCRGLDDAAWYEFSADDLTLLQPGVKNIREADSLSPYGVAVRMPNNHISWAFLLDLPGMLANWFPAVENRWEVWASIRGEGNDPESDAMLIGVYDGSNDKDHQQQFKLKDISGNYHWIKLATLPMGTGIRLYMAPTISDGVDNVFIDRVILKHAAE